jgi:putative ABC transport system ATP-binding protein
MIELEGVNKTYLVGGQPLTALKDISLSFADGEYVSVMGPSGSGKSTLLNMIGLLDRPDSGKLLIDGTETQDLPEEIRARLRRQQIGFIFQSFHLVSRLSALENIELPLMFAGISLKQRRQTARGVLEDLGMADWAAHLPKQLSGGQLQRVAIGRALVSRPNILLADEPTGNLDQKSGLEVINLLEELNKTGITLLVVTHDKILGDRARRRLQLVDGRVISDNPDALRVDKA